MSCVVLRQSFIQKVGRPFEKKVNSNENFKKKTSNNQQPLQIYAHKSSSSSSVDVHGYTLRLI